MRAPRSEAVGIPGDVEQDDTRANVVCLRGQHRMDARIADLVVDAYNGQLRTSESVTFRSKGPLGSEAVLLVDSSELAARVESVDGSRCNSLIIIADFRHSLQNGAGENLTRDLLERVVATGRCIRVPDMAST